MATPGKARLVRVHGSRAFVAAGDGGLAVVDVTDPFQAKWAGSMATPGKASLVRVHGKRVFIADSEAGLVVADISDPFRPTYVSRYGNSVNDLWNEGATLYVATPRDGLIALDASDPARLTPKASFKTKGAASLVRSGGGLVALHEADKGIWLLRDDGRTFKKLSFIKMAESIADMRLAGATLYVSSARSGLKTFDVAEPRSPRLKTFYPATENVGKMAFAGDFAFFGGENIISSLTLLPHVAITKTPAGYSASFPADMPIGAYDVVAMRQGRTEVLQHNAIEVKLPVKKKSKFTMEQFKKILEQRRNAESGQNPQQPPSTP